MSESGGRAASDQEEWLPGAVSPFDRGTTARVFSLGVYYCHPGIREGAVMTPRRFLSASLSIAVVASLLLAATGAVAAPAVSQSGFKTGQPSMLLTAEMAGVQITPLLTVGDVLPSGFRFEAIPDGISLRTRGQGRVDVFVNHETSKVPFPYNTAAPTAANGENDFDNSQVSRLVLNRHSAGVLSGSFMIDSSEGFQRFCSNYLATAAEGFDREILFTNEESPDYVLRQEASWPPSLVSTDQRESGLVIALDVQTGKYHPIYGMGRHNHENSVPIPGFDDLVVLSGDDTFTSGPLTGDLPDRGVGARAVAALLVHRVRHRRVAGRRGRPLGLCLRHDGCQELLQRPSRLRNGRHGPVHPGAEGHRHGLEGGWFGAEVHRYGGPGLRFLPAAAHERQLAD